MTVQAKHVIVYGRVQGVGFRYFVFRLGSRLGVSGTVRNVPDSTVEIYVEGESGSILEFLEAVRKGPPMSRVDSMDVTEIPVAGSYRGFQIEG